MKYNIVTDKEEKFKALTGPNLHTCFTEPYFLEPTYKPVGDTIHPIVIDPSGKACNIFPSNTGKPTKQWNCDSRVCNVDYENLSARLHLIYENLTSSSYQLRLQYIVTKMDECPNCQLHIKTTLGHPFTCHINNYGSTDSTFLSNLAPHYPFIRNVRRTIYQIRKTNTELNIIQNALEMSDIDILTKYGNQYKATGKDFNVHCELFRNEDEIIKKYMDGFQAMYAYQKDTPITSCISCEGLKPRRNLQAIHKLKTPIKCVPWDELKQLVNTYKLPNEHICSYCLKFLRKSQMPPTCLLNNLFVKQVPHEIQTLNQHERLLIQRAKAFQIVTKMGTISGKNKPISLLNQKVVGRTFHLPLPLEESLKKLPKPHQCLIPNQEMYIIIRGIPTKHRNIWESLVSVTNVYRALLWLKQNNHLYKEIQLPSKAEQLLNQINDVNIQFVSPKKLHNDNSQCSYSEDEETQSSQKRMRMAPANSVYYNNPDNKGDITSVMQLNTPFNTSLPPGFINEGNSCYANAVCQSLFSFDCITKNMSFIPQEGALNDFDSNADAEIVAQLIKIINHHEHEKKTLNDCTPLRSALGQPFLTAEQQDAEEFYMQLVSHCAVLRNMTRLEIRNTKTCSNQSCQDVTVDEEVDYILRIPILQSGNINQLVTNLLKSQPTAQASHCFRCHIDGTPCTRVQDIMNAPEIIACQLDIYEMSGSKKTGLNRIQELYITKLKIQDRSYNLQSVIYHHGESITSGHYTAAIRNEHNAWVVTSDTRVEVAPPPHSGDAYLLFYKLQRYIEDDQILAISPTIGNEIDVDDQSVPQYTIITNENECDVELPHHSDTSAPKAMLTQKNPSDEFYQHYTIYQINEKRANKDATELYQLLKVEGNLIDNRDLELDIRCFPDLYPYGENGMNEERAVHLSLFEYCKLRMISRNKAYRLNMQYLFFLMNLTNIRQIAAGIFHKMNVFSEKLTVADYLRKLKNRELDEDLCNVFAKLRNTAQYWFAPRSDVNTMIDNYGPATFFMTLSPGEYNWSDLDAFLRLVNKDAVCKGKSTAALIAMDPVSTSRFVDIKFKAIMKLIISENGPLGKIKHYFWRREYQTRGMQHFHILLWTEGAPVIGTSTNEEVAKFITKYITCTLPDKLAFPTLHRRVNKHQIHHHNSYCMRTKSTGRNKVKVCRYSFPRNVSETLVIRSVARSIYGRRNLKPNSRLYDLPRTEEERFINDYNAPILLAWEGNMDLQVICEKSTILSHYITKYQTKEEKSFNVDIFNDMNNNKSLGQNLWNIALRSLNSRECGALEAADTLLGNPLHGKDKHTVIRYVNVYRNRKRKVKKLQDMEKLSEDSTDIYCPSLVDNHYAERPDVLHSTCLYDFAKNYDVVKTASANEIFKFKYGFVKKRKSPCLIKHAKHSAQKNPEDYYYALLLLFKPWRAISDLRGAEYNTYAEAFDACREELTSAMEYHGKLQEITEENDKVEQIIDAIAKEHEDNSDSKQNKNTKENNYDVIEAAGAMADFRNAADNESEDDLDRLIKNLNSDQKRVFEHVTSHLENTKAILRHFVSGVGGTGKSFVIGVIRKWNKEKLAKDVAVCAPTGIAAFNISGLTVHRLLQLPVEHGGIPPYKKLNDDALEILRENLRNVNLLIIDEISMVSNLTLLYIHLRLSEIFDTGEDNDGWFGRIHVLLFGDLLQLPPVMQNPAFVSITESAMNKYLKCLYTPNIWEKLFSFDELTINVRQKEDEQFANILSRIRLGITTSEDIAILLKKRIIFKMRRPEEILFEICKYLQDLPVDAVCLVPTRSQGDDINRKMLDMLSTPLIELLATDAIQGDVNKKMRALKALNKCEDDSSLTAGLERRIEIKVGAKVMIRRNIDVTIGLVNGAVGIVKDVKIDADHRVETLYIELDSQVHKVDTVTSKFEILPRIYMYRTQFPISLAYGITIHKSQGLSLKNCVIDVGTRTFACGQSYVALSRVTTLQGLHIINFNPKGVKAQGKSIQEYNRLRKIFRPDLPIIDTTIIKSINSKKNDIIWYTTKNNQLEHLLTNNGEEMSHDQMLCRTPPKYTNVDGCYSYANSLCQCLFNMSSLIGHIDIISDNNDGDGDLYREKDLDGDTKIVETFKTLSKKHLQRIDNLNTIDLCASLGRSFIEKKEQNVHEFLLALLKHCACLRKSTNNATEMTIKCTNQLCGHAETQYNKCNIIPLYVQQPRITIDELLKFSQGWNIKNGDNGKFREESCKECNSICRTKCEVIKPAKILIFNIIHSENKVEKKTSNITRVTYTNITIDNSKYKLISSVFESYNASMNGTDIQYKAILRVGKKWYSINDNEIECIPWPSGSKGLKLLFYEKLSNCKGKK